MFLIGRIVGLIEGLDKIKKSKYSCLQINQIFNLYKKQSIKDIIQNEILYKIERNSQANKYCPA